MVVDGTMRLNDTGRIAATAWNDLPAHYNNVELDCFIVMPNHIHGILMLHDVGAGLKPAPTRHGLPEIVRAFKTFSSRQINEPRKTVGVPLWQRNYYEHVIRSEESLNRIRRYILDNPAQWQFDRENPAVVNPEPKDAWRI
jgi:REP element-mobilizing transposase RayT